MTGFHSSPDILNAMLAKADEKLAAARRDFKDRFYGEVSSRAYYAVFHAISAVLASRGMTFSSHAQVIGAFNKEFVKTAVFPPIPPASYSGFLKTGRYRITIVPVTLMKKPPV